jgi:hypothetical protein
MTKRGRTDLGPKTREKIQEPGTKNKDLFQVYEKFICNMRKSPIFFSKIPVAILFVFSLLSVEAQVNNPTFYEVPSTWQNIQINNEKIPTGLPRILIITNRPYIPDAEDREFFPNDLADFRKVSYLIATFDGKNWKLSFVSDFEEGMREIDDGRDILLFIEGHGKTLPMALNRAFHVQTRYNLSLIVFDWPSKNRNYNSSLARVRRCGDNFYNLMLQIKEYKKQSMDENQHFSILAHSLGNYFLSNLIVCGDAQYLNDVFIDNIIMNAAAIRSKEHGKVLSQMKFYKRLYITSNKYDWVLHGAHLLTAGRMLGIDPIKPLVRQAYYVNFTSVVGKEHSYYYGRHPFEHEYPAFFYFYNTSLHGKEVNLTDTTMFLPRNTRDGYNIRNCDLKK